MAHLSTSAPLQEGRVFPIEGKTMNGVLEECTDMGACDSSGADGIPSCHGQGWVHQPQVTTPMLPHGFAVLHMGSSTESPHHLFCTCFPEDNLASGLALSRAVVEPQASVWKGVETHSQEAAAPTVPKQTPFLLLSFQNLTVEGAHIVAGDIASTNGIIHVIDKVYGQAGTICSSAPQAMEHSQLLLQNITCVEQYFLLHLLLAAATIACARVLTWDLSALFPGSDSPPKHCHAKAAGPPGANARLLHFQGLHYRKLSHLFKYKGLHLNYCQNISDHPLLFVLNVFHNSNTAWQMK